MSSKNPPLIFLSSFDNKTNCDSDDNEEIKEKEKKIFEKETADDELSPKEEVKQAEYTVFPSVTMSLEIQEACIAKKLVKMYERKINMKKSTFHDLRKLAYDSEPSSNEDDNDFFD